MDEERYALKCRCCDRGLMHPVLEQPLDTWKPHELRKELRAFDVKMFRHTNRYGCRNGGGRIFTRGMFKMMDVFIRELVREQNLKWLKAAFRISRWLAMRDLDDKDRVLNGPPLLFSCLATLAELK